MYFNYRLGCLLIAFIVLTGCGDSHDGSSHADHDHDHGHDHGHEHEHSDVIHLSFAEVVEKIGTHRDAIQTAFANDKKDDAHDPLHDIGFLIERLSDAAAETDMSEEDWNAVKQAAEQLASAFGKVDGLFHDDPEGVPFSDVESDVQTALTTLQAKVDVAVSTDKFEQPAGE